MSGAMAILRLRLSTIPRSRPSSPRSRSAGRPAPRCQSHNKKFTTQLSPLPQRGRGAGGEGRPHLPPQPPFLAHAVGEEGGLPHLPSGPLPLPRCGKRKGVRVLPHLLPGPLPFPYEESKGEMSLAVALLRLSTMPRPQIKSPLSRSAGEGLGVRAALTFPPTPFRSHQASGRGRHERSNGDPTPAAVNDTPFTTQLTPLPQRGRGAGGEGKHSPTPTTLPETAPQISHCPSQRRPAPPATQSPFAASGREMPPGAASD